jgi:hypothetical protein
MMIIIILTKYQFFNGAKRIPSHMYSNWDDNDVVTIYYDVRTASLFWSNC